MASNVPDFAAMTDQQYATYWRERDAARQERELRAAAAAECDILEVTPEDEVPNELCAITAHDEAMVPCLTAERHGWRIDHYNDGFVFMSRMGAFARNISIDRKTGKVESVPF